MVWNVIKTVQLITKIKSFIYTSVNLCYFAGSNNILDREIYGQHTKCIKNTINNNKNT